MPKKMVTPKKKSPPKFLSVNGPQCYVHGRHATEAAALGNAVSNLQPTSHTYSPEFTAVYRLVKILRPKETPVEIEEIAECEDCN